MRRQRPWKPLYRYYSFKFTSHFFTTLFIDPDFWNSLPLNIWEKKYIEHICKAKKISRFYNWKEHSERIIVKMKMSIRYCLRMREDYEKITQEVIEMRRTILDLRTRLGEIEGREFVDYVPVGILDLPLYRVPMNHYERSAVVNFERLSGKRIQTLGDLCHIELKYVRHQRDMFSVLDVLLRYGLAVDFREREDKLVWK